MQKIKFKALLCSFALIGSLSTFTSHAATAWPPEGGQWNYGVGALGSHSDYINPTRAHGSTVNHNGTKYPASAPAGYWSQALAPGIYSGCSFYYNI